MSTIPTETTEWILVMIGSKEWECRIVPHATDVGSQELEITELEFTDPKNRKNRMIRQFEVRNTPPTIEEAIEYGRNPTAREF
jgi:hypothetical protein